MNQSEALAEIHAEACTPSLAEEQAFLKVGDPVVWRGSFGAADPAMARVTGIHMILDGNKNHTVCQQSAAWVNFTGRSYLVDLDNGHWAYADQIFQPAKSGSKSESELI